MTALVRFVRGAIAADGSLSPESFRAGQLAATEGVGHLWTCDAREAPTSNRCLETHLSPNGRRIQTNMSDPSRRGRPLFASSRN